MTLANGSTSRRSLHQIFAVPAALALLSAAGLVSALVGDDIWDALSWLTLAAPVLTVLVYLWPRSKASRGQERSSA